MFYSPLRYPGGKNKLAPFLAKVCLDNKIDNHYIEPFAGGASVALFLLIEGYVSRITINDKDKSIHAFWYSILNNCDEFCELIRNTEISIENWHKQREIQKNKNTSNTLELGFSTFYLNRTNRSGIIKAGVIGGLNQEGNFKMDCRFNKKELINKIELISKYSSKINLYNYDALELIDTIINDKETEKSSSIFYFDPPYYLKAESLYMNHFKHEDHKILSDKIKSINNIHWIVSYDDNINIENLYYDEIKLKYSFNHSAFESRDGKELIFHSENLRLPIIENFNPTKFKLNRSNLKKEIKYLY
ncbi:DNA adenine methylase [Flavobacterium phycosphaerae]|uniref:DNA adenine methylase n=1 Tax=Flavobacterium phycosphaerae TaxID=2697515 RepID=UPI00138AB5CB|nr:DNA adenine methylase [Flavobacterium phycosphaerae]